MVVFGAGANQATVTALLRNLTFRNTTRNPTAAARTLAIVAGDGGQVGAAATLTVTSPPSMIRRS